jgi:NitT/TauT family transport system substrate-binding protein
LIAIIAVTGVTVGVYYYEQYQRNLVDVRMGYLLGDLHHLAYFVAVEKGLYEDEGINVEGIAYPNGGEVMTAYVSSQRPIDMAYLGFAPAVFYRFNNPAADIKILSPVNVNGTALVVKDEINIKNATDLENLTIAVPAKNNMQDFILRMILDEAGLDYETDLNVTQISDLSNMLLLFQQGDIDGYVAWEPVAVKGVAPGIGKYLYKSGDVWENHPCCVLTAHESFINDDPELVEKVVAIHKQTTEWILNNWEEAISIAEEKMNLSHEQATEAMDNIGYVTEFNIPEMVTFVDKLTTLNPNVKFGNSGLPTNIETSTQFIDWFLLTLL